MIQNGDGISAKEALIYSQWGLIPRPLGRLELVNTHEK
jgi:hypothetical protein